MPLLYQVATSQLNPSDVALNIRRVFNKRDNVDVTMAGVVDADASATCVTLDDGQQIDGDFLVGGGKPTELLRYARRGRTCVSALLALRRRAPAFEDPAGLRKRRPRSVARRSRSAHIRRRGFGPDGHRDRRSARRADRRGDALRVPRSRRLSGAGDPGRPRGRRSRSVLREGPRVRCRSLQKDGVELQLGVGVEDVAADHVTLSDGSTIPTRCVIWAEGCRRSS